MSFSSAKTRIKAKTPTSASIRKEDYVRLKSFRCKQLTESSSLRYSHIQEGISIEKEISVPMSSANDISNSEISHSPSRDKLLKQVKSHNSDDVPIEESISDIIPNTEELTNTTSPSISSQPDEYDEDFESYESDFEEDNNSDYSVHEESEISESSSSSDAIPSYPFQNILDKDEPIQPKSSIAPTEMSQTSDIRPKTSKSIINFAKAKATQIKKQASEKIKSRGQIIWDMIELDVISIELYTQIPESYEAYINAFASANKSLASVQTNEDNLSDSAQTNDCQMLSKWTQKPIHISMDGNEMPSAQHYIGVGGDGGEVQQHSSVQTSGAFIKFLFTSASVVLQLLEESLSMSYENPKEVDANASGFGRRIKLGSGIQQLLANRAAAFVTCCPSDLSILITGHSPTDEHNLSGLDSGLGDEAEAPNGQLWSASLLCLWSVHQPSMPQAILYARALPLVATFSPGKPVVVIAGMSDGTLSCWDLREESKNHKQFSGVDCRIQPPSYMTSCDDDVQSSGSPIVAIYTLAIDNQLATEHKGSFQVVTLRNDGEITWWVVVQELIQARIGGVSAYMGAAPWSYIALLKAAQQHVTDILSQEVLLEGTELCCDLHLSGREKSQYFVALTTGVVLHMSRYNVKLRPHFLPEVQPGTRATSLSVNPHDPNFILVGSFDGTIRLHSLASTLPITQWQATIDPSSVRKVVWSQSRPCVFYMLDDMGCVYMWDLCAGDIYPVVSLQSVDLIAEGKLNCMEISGTLLNDRSKTFHAVFGSDRGGFVLCSISPKYISLSKEDYESELEQFRCYVSII